MKPSSQVTEFWHHRDFVQSVAQLRGKGGQYQKAAEKVNALLNRIDQEYAKPFKELSMTTNGEHRIKKCIKYKLSDSCRLVTLQSANYCVLLFAGDHTASDKWLERNRGLEFVVNKENKHITPIHRSISTNPDQRISGSRSWQQRPVCEQLEKDSLNRLLKDVSPSTMMGLTQLNGTSEESELATLLESIDTPDRKIAIWDVFSLLMQGRKEEANDRARVFMGVLTPLEDFSALELPEIVDGPLIRKIPTNHPQFPTAFERFTRTGNYKDWMLFIHPDQEKIAQAKFDGSAKLTGVSGSGKTCVVVHRATELATRYPNEKILILTLNRPLAGLINELVGWYAPPEISERIRTLAFFELCKELISHFEPEKEKYLNDITSTTKEHHFSEHIDEIWRQFYRCELNLRDAEVLQAVHDSLLAREISPEKYLREEFDWIRSAIPFQEQAKRYLDIPRKGRSQNLSKDFRQSVLDGLSKWRVQMTNVGAIDHLGIAEWLSKHKDRITPEYRCVLVDESQDFGTVELDLVRRLVSPGSDDIFLAGDAAQHVTWKHQSLTEAGITVPGARSRTMHKNYRNSKEILKAAHFVLTENISEEMLDNENFEVLDPEYAQRSGNEPFLFSANTPEEEISSAIAYLEKEIDADLERKGCLAICGYSLFEIEDYGKRLGIPVLDRSTSIESNKIFLSDLEQTKGFEFDIVCIVNINKRVIPNPQLPEQEHFRDLARLYVAMTRAKTELVLSYSGDQSRFLSGMDEYCLNDTWRNHTGDAEQIGLPDNLDNIRQENVETPPIAAMNGAQFLYQSQAIGLARPLISKIRELINGRTTLGANKNQITWKTIGDCALSFDSKPASRRAWGIERSGLADLFSKLGIQERRVKTQKNRQQMIVLANSRKQNGSCVAGKIMDGKNRSGDWLRPVSTSPMGEIAYLDTLYNDGTALRPLDIVEFEYGAFQSHANQPENVLFENFHWKKIRHASFSELEKFQDENPHFLKILNTGRNDRVLEVEAAKFGESLGLIRVANAKLVLVQSEYRKQLRIIFTHQKTTFNLAVTDRAVEKKYLNQKESEHLLPKAYICVSVGEPYHGYCYRLAACVMTP
jgi:superfamily I DNA/RNA helicase